MTRTGENLPCLKAQFFGEHGKYHEPKFYDAGSRKNAEYIEAVTQGRVLVAVYLNKEGEDEKPTATSWASTRLRMSGTMKTVCAAGS